MLEQEGARLDEAGELRSRRTRLAAPRGRRELALERPKPLYEKLIPEYNQK